MKRLIVAFCITCVVLVFAACAEGNETVTETPTLAETQTEVPDVPPSEIDIYEPEPLPPFEGKVAIVSNYYDSADGEYISAKRVIERYGKDKIIHVTWPINFMAEQEQVIDTAVKLGSDPDIKVIIINRAVPGTNVAIKKLKEIREDVFVIYITPQDDLTDMIQIADIIFDVDELGMGSAMVQQAQKMGAKTFVHYSFPLHMAQPLLSARRDLIKETCEKLDMVFVDAISENPTEVGIPSVKEFLLDSVPKMVDKYGKDTAFFATHCAMQVPLIESVVDAGAIYPQPCCPSPYHGIVLALDILSGSNKIVTVDDIIALERDALSEKNMLGRVSTWPESSFDLLTAASAEYAIKWINGEVPQEGVDVEVLKQLMEDYAGVEVFLTPFVDDGTYDVLPRTSEPTGETFDNFLLMRMDYITY